MPESVKQRFSKSALDKMSERELRILIAALVDGVQALAAKLDADAANTALNDTNYAATFATFVTD
jgi:hypothetical protein